MVARFQHKVAFVTGACSAIGLATAERFVPEGARVLAADVQDEAGAALPFAVLAQRRFFAKTRPATGLDCSAVNEFGCLQRPLCAGSRPSRLPVNPPSHPSS